MTPLALRLVAGGSVRGGESRRRLRWWQRLWHHWFPA
jgi:hypothetical protein